MRNARRFHGCFSINEKGTTTKVVAMGGSSWSGTLSTAEILDITTMQWEDLPDLPFRVSHNKGVESVTGPYLGFSVAGFNGDSTSYENRIIGLRKDQNGNYYWQVVNNQLTTGRSLPAVVNAGGIVPSC